MNQGIFWIRGSQDEEREAGHPVFRAVHGYVVKKYGVRVGVYRVTNDGLSEYRAVDLRDGIELSNGLTIHETVKYAMPQPTADMVEDPDVFADIRALWNHAMTHPIDGVTFPAY